MVTIKRSDRFWPTPVPQNIPIGLQDWLREELERLALVANESLDTSDALRALPRMFLAGDTDDLVLDVIEAQFVNYTQGGAIGEVPIDPDLVAGTITVPLTGIYNLVAYVIGHRTSGQNNDSIFLHFGVNGVLQIINTFDIAPLQIDTVTFSVTLSRTFQKDDVVTMWLSATEDIGVFTVDQTALEMLLLALPTEVVSQQILDGMEWFPAP